jgi:hypothetical protein
VPAIGRSALWQSFDSGCIRRPYPAVRMIAAWGKKIVPQGRRGVELVRLRDDLDVPEEGWGSTMREMVANIRSSFERRTSETGRCRCAGRGPSSMTGAMAVAVVDPAGILVYFEKVDATQHGSVQVAMDKARSGPCSSGRRRRFRTLSAEAERESRDHLDSASPRSHVRPRAALQLSFEADCRRRSASPGEQPSEQVWTCALAGVSALG